MRDHLEVLVFLALSVKSRPTGVRLIRSTVGVNKVLALWSQRGIEHCWNGDYADVLLLLYIRHVVDNEMMAV